MEALLTNLTEDERGLLRETERDRMAPLDEDELIALHSRVRRARNKHVGRYRRKASALVAEKGGRGLARPKSTRSAGRAELFEDALARVSRRLAVVAKQAAAELKDERLTAARAQARAAKAARAADPAATAGRGAAASSPVVPDQRSRGDVSDTRPPARLKRDASTLATGARRQAGKDNR